MNIQYVFSPFKYFFPGHTLLSCDKERDHYRRSFELIDQGVFQAEDIFVSEGAQRGMRSGANSELLFGALEDAAIKFHRIIETELQPPH